MHNIVFSFLFFILTSTNSFSQEIEKKDIENLDKDVRDVTKITFLAPGISFEKRISKFQTISTQAFLSTSIYFGYSSSLGTTSGIDFYPAVGLQYRYYYNAAKREAKGKRTEMNSMNYLSAAAELTFYREHVSFNLNKENRASKSIGVLWGLQRNYPRRFSLDLGLGAGYIFRKETVVNDVGQYSTKDVVEFTSLGHISLGFWINKRD